MSEINYNDGAIHGWNGGDMPVHPKTIVTYWTDEGHGNGAFAGALEWGFLASHPIRAFRVLKEHVDLRLFIARHKTTGKRFIFDREEDAQEYVDTEQWDILEMVQVQK